MKKRFLLPLFGLLLGGCQNQEREQKLQKMEADLAHREQELLLKEQALALREQALAQAPPVVAAATDSTRQLAPADSVRARGLTGTWATRMNCIETDCPGSAIGDSKNEQWEFSYAHGTVLVKASANKKVVRVYTGTLTGNALELTAQHITGETLPDAAITVQLQVATDQRLEGRREINRPNTCRIVYALDLTKETLPPR